MPTASLNPQSALRDPQSIMVQAEAHGRDWSIYQADCVDFARQLPDNCIDLTIYSPPFANLYIYSDSEADMGNCADDAEFLEQYSFWLREKLRITRPGRLSAVHCKNLVNYKGRDGMAGMRDFRGELIRAHVEAGWAYHAEAVIWKDPVIEMQRTKAHGLLYKQLRTDSTFSRMGMPEYMLYFRKWSDDAAEWEIPVEHARSEFELDQWQRWASPVWMDIRQTHVLNGQVARESRDEKHICPLQLDVIERSLVLYSLPGETVMSPFMGIGSEGYQSLAYGRRFVGTELKGAYFERARRFLERAECESGTSLLDVGETAENAEDAEVVQ